MKLYLLAATLLMADVPGPGCGGRRDRDAERMEAELERARETSREQAREELMECLRAAPETAGSATQAAAACVVAKIERAACRSAWSGYDESAEATAKIATACAADYCEILPAPRPHLCADPSVSLTTLDGLRRWTELHAAVLAYDLKIRRPEELAWLGVSLAAFAPLRSADKTVVTLPAPELVPAATPEPSATVLQVALAADGTLSVDGKLVELSGLEARIKEVSGANPLEPLSMILQADSMARHADVVRLMDGARSMGVDRISIAVERPQPAAR